MVKCELRVANASCKCELHWVRWGNLGLRGNLGLFAFSLLKQS